MNSVYNVCKRIVLPMKTIAAYLMLFAAPLWPQAPKTEAELELQRQLASIRQQLDNANRERAALTVALKEQTQAQTTNNTKAAQSQAAAHDQRAASDTLATDNAIIAQQTAVAAAVASATTDALTKGRSEQQQATSDRGLYVTLATQFLTLLIGLCAFGYSQITTRQKRRWEAEDLAKKEKEASEARERLQHEVTETRGEVGRAAQAQSAKLDQIHILVNSKMTDAMEKELAALREVQQLLKGNIINLQSQGITPNASIIEAEVSATDRVAELAAVLVGRARETRAADAVRAQETLDSKPVEGASNLNGPRKDPNLIDGKLGKEILGQVKEVKIGVETLLDQK